MGTIELAPALDLSLFRLDSELEGLIEYRQSRLMDAEEPPAEEEIAALDAEIRRYEIATPAKVSGVVAVARKWKSQRETAKAEISRLQQIVRNIEVMESWLKDEYLKPILERQPEPKKGSRKLTGADGSVIALKGNGGVAPLVITDEAAVPLDRKKATVVMPADEWESFREHMLDIGMTLISEDIALDNHAIREAIADTGGIPGAHLAERGQHIEIR